MKNIILISALFIGFSSFGQNYYISIRPAQRTISDVIYEQGQLDAQHRANKLERDKFEYQKQQDKRQIEQLPTNSTKSNELKNYHGICIKQDYHTLIDNIKEYGIKYSETNNDSLINVSLQDDLSYYFHLFYNNIGICTVVIPKQNETSDTYYNNINKQYKKLNSNEWEAFINQTLTNVEYFKQGKSNVFIYISLDPDTKELTEAFKQSIKNGNY